MIRPPPSPQTPANCPEGVNGDASEHSPLKISIFDIGSFTSRLRTFPGSTVWDIWSEKGHPPKPFMATLYHTRLWKKESCLVAPDPSLSHSPVPGRVLQKSHTHTPLLPPNSWIKLETALDKHFLPDSALGLGMGGGEGEAKLLEPLGRSPWTLGARRRSTTSASVLPPPPQMGDSSPPPCVYCPQTLVPISISYLLLEITPRTSSIHPV